MSLSQQETRSGSQKLEDVVIDLVTTTLGKKSDSVKPEDPLFSTQTGFDSFSLMEFVLRLEDAFSISIPDEHLDPDIFASVNTIVTYVQTRLE